MHHHQHFPYFVDVVADDDMPISTALSADIVGQGMDNTTAMPYVIRTVYGPLPYQHHDGHGLANNCEDYRPHVEIARRLVCMMKIVRRPLFFANEYDEAKTGRYSCFIFGVLPWSKVQQTIYQIVANDLSFQKSIGFRGLAHLYLG